MDLLDLLPREITHICPDAVHLPAFLSSQQQLDLLLICRSAAAQTGMVRPVVGGFGDKQLRMQVKVTSLGYYWTPTEGYKTPILAMPEVLVQIANAAVAKTIPRLAPFAPDTAILQWYEPGTKLGMHRDDSEDKALLDAGSPIVSISLGDSALFRFSNEVTEKKIRDDIELRSGDVFVFGGQSRMAYHGITKIIPETAPTGMKPGRLNITIRQAKE